MLFIFSSDMRKTINHEKNSRSSEAEKVRPFIIIYKAGKGCDSVTDPAWSFSLFFHSAFVVGSAGKKSKMTNDMGQKMNRLGNNAIKSRHLI